MYQREIELYIEEHKDEMIEDIKKLIRINSERKPAVPGKPYGEGAAACLDLAEEMMMDYGFYVRNYDHYVVTADLNDKEKQLDILAHLDVVPAGDDWTVTEPFKPVVIDGRLYGRGSADDKGPAVAALYAMRIIKDLNIELSKNVRLILGSDEECGSSDIAYYFKKEKQAPMTFSPDAEFPVINIEKGGLKAEFEASYEEDKSLPRVVSIKGGDKVNVVPGKAEAVVEGLDKDVLLAAAKKVNEEIGIEFAVTDLNDGCLKINAKGQGCHASTPEIGNNALTGLINLLVSLPMADSEGFRKLKSINRLFVHNDFHGAALGVDMEDEISGRLSMCFSILDYGVSGFKGQFDSRAPLCATNENLYAVVKAKMAEEGIKLEDTGIYAAHHVDADSPFVKTLLKCYEKHSGKEGKAMAIGGGTYVHHIDNGVAFGCGSLDLDNHMHGADEFVIIDDLIMSVKIFADAIIELCR